jgi:hypothetical protein
MASPSIPFVPILDVRPALEHAFGVADEACYLVAPPPNGSVSFPNPFAGGLTFAFHLLKNFSLMLPFSPYVAAFPLSRPTGTHVV